MKNNKHFFKAGKCRLVIGAVIVSMLAGSVGYADGLHAGITVNVPGVFAPQDDYIYYPAYNVYYSSHQHQYAYQDHGAWVARSAPPGVTVGVLHASPSVKMDFHDSPANHHADIVKKYPKNWSDHGHGGKDDHNDR